VGRFLFPFFFYRGRTILTIELLTGFPTPQESGLRFFSFWSQRKVFFFFLLAGKPPDPLGDFFPREPESGWLLSGTIFFSERIPSL